MADKKISALAELETAPTSEDLIEVVDVSDTTMAASGTNKKSTVANLGLLTGWIPNTTTPVFATSTTYTLAGVNRTTELTKGTKIKQTFTGADQTKALDLDSASTQYASIADGSQTGLDITGDITIEAWIKPESFAGDRRIVRKVTAAANLSYELYIDYDATNGHGFTFRYSADGSSWTDFKFLGGIVETDKWLHVAVVVDVSATSATLYLNGVSQTQTSTSGTGTSIYNGNAPFEIGGLSGVGSFDGIISEVRVWNDVRTQDEIRSNMYINVASDAAGLVGNWKLDDDYLDETSNNNDLTASGNPVFATDIPDEFGGTNYYYVVSSTFSTNTTVTVTGEKWIPNTTLAGFYSYNDCPQGFKRGEDWYKASAYLGTQQNDLTNGTVTQISLDTETFDTNSNFNTSTYEYTAPVSGVYSIVGQASFANTVADKRYQAFIYVDGSERRVATSHIAGAGGGLVITVPAKIALTKGETVDLRAKSVAGVNTVDVDDGATLTNLDIQFVGL